MTGQDRGEGWQPRDGASGLRRRPGDDAAAPACINTGAGVGQRVAVGGWSAGPDNPARVEDPLALVSFRLPVGSRPWGVMLWSRCWLGRPFQLPGRPDCSAPVVVRVWGKDQDLGERSIVRAFRLRVGWYAQPLLTPNAAWRLDSDIS